jgi:hypothetical protein
MKKGNIFTKKSKQADIEEPEEVTVPSDELEQEKEQVPADVETQDAISSEKPTEPEAKPPSEKSELTNKQKISALKRALENKTSSLNREKSKVRDWRSQAETRNTKATEEFEKLKSKLEESLKKSEDRYQKRIAKTQKMWIEYSDNYEATKINKIEKDITLLEAELFKLEVTHPEPSVAE